MKVFTNLGKRQADIAVYLRRRVETIMFLLKACNLSRIFGENQIQKLQPD